MDCIQILKCIHLRKKCIQNYVYVLYVQVLVNVHGILKQIAKIYFFKQENNHSNLISMTYAVYSSIKGHKYFTLLLLNKQTKLTESRQQRKQSAREATVPYVNVKVTSVSTTKTLNKKHSFLLSIRSSRILYLRGHFISTH